MRKLFIAILFLLFLVNAHARQTEDNPDSLFLIANEAFANEFYSEAIDQYERIIEIGYVSADLYFNLGNAYYKIKDYPSAILFYEKAKKLDPRDDDIRFNLEVANSMIVDKIEDIPAFFLKKWWQTFIHIFSADSWAIITITGFILFFILFSFYLLSRNIQIRKISFFTGLGILLLTIFTFIVTAEKYHYVSSNDEAIVFTPTITVKSSPNPNSVDLFVIHEGLKVEILDKVGNWYEIRIASGSVGWLPSESVKMI